MAGVGLLLALLLVSGCGGPGATPTVPAPTVSVIRRITPEALAAALPSGRIVLLDVRDPADYAIRHLPGARSFPLTTAGAHLSELPRDRPIVAYCA